MANDQVAGFEAQLHVALDNMPGALVYTDVHLNIVFCNDQFRKMYAVSDPGRQAQTAAANFRCWGVEPRRLSGLLNARTKPVACGLR